MTLTVYCLGSFGEALIGGNAQNTRSPRGFYGRIQSRFVGVELYFENLERAKKFYVETMGLKVSDEQAGHHAKFDSGAGFVCLERKGAESYPSQDKAVLFFEVADLTQAITAIGRQHVVQFERHGLCCTTLKGTTYYYVATVAAADQTRSCRHSRDRACTGKRQPSGECDLPVAGDVESGLGGSIGARAKQQVQRSAGVSRVVPHWLRLPLKGLEYRRARTAVEHGGRQVDGLRLVARAGCRRARCQQAELATNRASAIHIQGRRRFGGANAELGLAGRAPLKQHGVALVPLLSFHRAR